MEWGNFWSSHLPRTMYDDDLDRESLNPQEQVRKCSCFPFPKNSEAFVIMRYLIIVVDVGF